MKLIKKSSPNADIPEASMADIGFLLMIFFLVTTTFEVQRGISYRLPKRADQQTQEVVVDESNRLVMTIKQWGQHEYVALIDQAPAGGPLQRARAGEDVSLQDTSLTSGIRYLAEDRAEPLSASKARLLANLEISRDLQAGTYSSLQMAIEGENIVAQVRPGIMRALLGSEITIDEDPIFGQVAFGDTLVLSDPVSGVIASVVRESELVVILKFFPDCDYDGMIQAIDVLRRNGVSRTGITIQERTAGAV
jgi:biopolymer transport protein ExbD